MASACVKLIEHAMKIVEDILERSMRNIVIMPGKGTIDAVFIQRKTQEE